MGRYERSLGFGRQILPVYIQILSDIYASRRSRADRRVGYGLEWNTGTGATFVNAIGAGKAAAASLLGSAARSTCSIGAQAVCGEYLWAAHDA